MSNLLQQWKKSRLLQIGSLITVILIITGIVFQNVIGTHPSKTGTEVFRTDSTVLVTNSTMIYNASFSEDNQFIVFVANAELEFYLFDFGITEGENITAIREQALYYELTGMSYNGWFSNKDILSLVVITGNSPENITISCYMRDYTPDQMKAIEFNNTGTIIVVIGFVIPAIYIIFHIYQRKRGLKGRLIQKASNDSDKD